MGCLVRLLAIESDIQQWMKEHPEVESYADLESYYEGAAARDSGKAKYVLHGMGRYLTMA